MMTPIGKFLDAYNFQRWLGLIAIDIAPCRYSRT